MPPPLPAHHFHKFSRANIPVKLELDRASTKVRSQLETTFQHVHEFLSKSGALPEQFDRIFVHPGGGVYVTPGKEASALRRPGLESHCPAAAV
jgi:hypothetical protein